MGSELFTIKINKMKKIILSLGVFFSLFLLSSFSQDMDSIAKLPISKACLGEPIAEYNTKYSVSSDGCILGQKLLGLLDGKPDSILKEYGFHLEYDEHKNPFYKRVYDHPHGLGEDILVTKTEFGRRGISIETSSIGRAKNYKFSLYDLGFKWFGTNDGQDFLYSGDRKYFVTISGISASRKVFYIKIYDMADLQSKFLSKK